MPAEAPFRLRNRILLAVMLSLVSGLLCYLLLYYSTEDNWAGDFSWALFGAEYLLAGENPYDGDYPRTDPLFYPLPALFIAIPFVPFPPEIAGALFFALSAGILAFAATRYGYTYLPLFISAPYLIAMITAQWSLLLLAAAFLPFLLPFVIAKPSLGAALLLTFPNRYAIAAIAGIVGISFLVQPTWPVDWFEALRSTSHPMALMILPGPLVLLALLHWRDKMARFLLMMAIIPQRLFFYDQLLLWLVVRTTRQSLYFALTSWVGLVGWAATARVDQVELAAFWVVLTMYLPATVIVLMNGRHEPGTLVSRVEQWVRSQVSYRRTSV